jgi:WD40 repeat protein
VDGYRRGITALAISPDGSRLATGDSAGLLKLIDVPTGEVRASFQAHRYGNGISALAFSPDGTLVATAGYLETVVRLWGAAEGESRGQLPELPTGVRALTFSPGGALLALARGDGAAMLWGMAESRVLGTVRANDRALEAIAFSADGRALATGGTEGRVRLWDLGKVLDGGTRARGGVAPPDPVSPPESPDR